MSGAFVVLAISRGQKSKNWLRILDAEVGNEPGYGQMRANAHGFTLIELMIVIAIIGVLASLAVAAFQTFTVRAQVAEGLNMAASAKTPITDAYTSDGTAPADRTAAGMTANATDTRGNYVSQVSVSNGRIDVTFGGPKAHADIIGESLSLTPYESLGNTLIWRCGNAPAPGGAPLLVGGDAHVDATVDARYLPTVCR